MPNDSFFHPRYLAALEALNQLPNDEHNSDEANKLYHELFRYAPVAVKQYYYEYLYQSGLVPRASGYTAEGEPLFHPRDLAQHYGISEEKAIDILLERERRGFEGTIVPAELEVHKVH